MQPVLPVNVDYAGLARQLSTTDVSDIYRTIVDAPFADKKAMAFLFLGFITVFAVDEAAQEIQMLAQSSTEQARLSLEKYNFDPASYRLPLDQVDNAIVRAVIGDQPQNLTDWTVLARRSANIDLIRFNQANSGIAYSAVYPLTGAIRGALLYNYFQYIDRVGDAQYVFMQQYTQLVSDELAHRA